MTDSRAKDESSFGKQSATTVYAALFDTAVGFPVLTTISALLGQLDQRVQERRIAALERIVQQVRERLPEIQFEIRTTDAIERSVVSVLERSMEAGQEGKEAFFASALIDAGRDVTEEDVRSLFLNTLSELSIPALQMLADCKEHVDAIFSTSDIYIDDYCKRSGASPDIAHGAWLSLYSKGLVKGAPNLDGRGGMKHTIASDKQFQGPLTDFGKSFIRFILNETNK